MRLYDRPVTDRLFYGLGVRLLRAFGVISAAVGMIILIGCGASGPRRSSGDTGPSPSASVVAVDQGGGVRWRAALSTGSGMDEQLPPVVSAGVGYFAQGGRVTAIRLQDGHQQWSRSLGDSVYGVWRSGGIVAVLVDQVGEHAELWGLSVSGGGVRWKLPIGGSGIVGDPVATDNGDLVWLRGGRAQAIDLATGRASWSVPVQESPMVTRPGLVIVARNGAVAALDDRTGVVRWTQAHVPGVSPQELGNVLLATTGTVGTGSPTDLASLDPSTGRLLWTFDPRPGDELDALGIGPAGLLVSDSQTRDVYLLDPATARIRWKVITFLGGDLAPDITARDVVNVEGGSVDFPSVDLVDRSASTGAVVWKTHLGVSPGGRQVLRDGSRIVLSTAAGPANNVQSFNAGTGATEWKVRLPEPVTETPIAINGLYVTQSASLPQSTAD